MNTALWNPRGARARERTRMWVLHSPLSGQQGGSSERSFLFSLPWNKISKKIMKIKKFKNRREMKMKGWGGGGTYEKEVIHTS